MNKLVRQPQLAENSTRRALANTVVAARAYLSLAYETVMLTFTIWRLRKGGSLQALQVLSADQLPCRTTVERSDAEREIQYLKQRWL